jgi:hypothetical protein
MTNPAKEIFEKNAHTGFYTSAGDEPVITIEVKYDANADGTVTFTYNRTTGKWKPEDGDEVDIPRYQSADGASPIEISKKTDTISNVGDWMIVVEHMPKGVSLDPEDGEAITPYLRRVCAAVYLAWGDGNAARRTVYMDSNIALTDGSAPVGSGTAKTIPNLYKAIHDMDTRIVDMDTELDKISQSHGPSTADAGLFVTYNAQEAITDGSTQKVITMSPAEFNNESRTNADKGNSAGEDETVFRISAPNIEFEVTNQNTTATGWFVKFTGDKVPETIQTVNSVVLKRDATYTLVPVEGSEITANLGEGNEYPVAAGIHCKLFTNNNTGSVYILAVPHMVVTTEMGLTHIKENGNFSGDITVPSVMRYRLGAIIEAIQELNRRTMFMDTDMTFQGAMSYNDYNGAAVETAQHTKNLDGLPAASDSNIGQHA